MPMPRQCFGACLATAGEICSSVRNRSTLLSFFGSGWHDKAFCLRQHSGDFVEVPGLIVAQGVLNLVRERPGIVQGRLNLGHWPLQMLRRFLHVAAMAADS